ncbi:MAG: hypothetical protein NT077_00235 [Candidatus Taylorbacteria bacterium]|nr:hypothetical protein [Candidatus Taylorbacteria bacterium]
MRAKDYFLGKRIAVIGIGPHGEMLSDIKFLVKANALVSVYDMRSEARLIGHLSSLRSFGLANQVLSSIPAGDLMDMDLIILSHDYPRNSSFLAEARKNGIEIEYPETLFLKLAPPVSVIGVMGACGKATVISMLAPMLEDACAKNNQLCVTLDPESEDGIISHLKKVKTGDIVVMRVVPKMMPEITALKWSPQVAVFTTIPSEISFKESAFEIIGYQTYNNYVIGNDLTIDAVRSSGFQSKAKMLRTKSAIVPEDWLPNARTPHDRENAALALEAARIFKVSDEVAMAVLSEWKPLKGHLELVKKLKNIEFVNDSASTSPISTVANMAVLSANKNLVLIFGGADQGSDYGAFYAAVKEYIHTLVAIPGSGTLKERPALRRMENVTVLSAPSLEEAVRQARDHAKKGDKVLFSPAFEACGIDASRKERGERFVRAVRAL